MVYNKMNTNFYATNTEEKVLCQIIEEMNKSDEIQKFAKDLENILKDYVKIFSYRIKEQFSALRTYRLANYDKAQKLHDLLGFLIVVDKESEIEKVEKILKSYLSKDDNAKTYDLLREKKFEVKHYSKIKNKIDSNQYNKLIFDDINTWLKVPNELEKLLLPFSYNILCTKKFKDMIYEVPIEIRIQTKEDFITTESYYYTIHKNDNIELNVKIPLLCMCFRILRRMSKIDFESNTEVKKNYELEIKKIQDENISFIEENKENLDCIFKEYNRILNCWKNKLPIYDFKRI